jgi:hypothetical protein
VIWVPGGIAHGFNGVLAEALELVRGSIPMGIGLARLLRSLRLDLPIVLVSGYTAAIQTQQALPAV